MNRNRKVKEYRAELKTLVEQRAELLETMNKTLGDAKAENRAMKEEEEKTFAESEAAVKRIDATIEAEKRAQKLSVEENPDPKNKDTLEQRATDEAEERAFANFLRNNVEELRAGNIQLTEGNNGTIVPTKIADRIIKEVRDMVPYLQLSDVIYTNGKLSVPKYSETSENYINADYVDEGSELTDNIGKFESIDLAGFVIGALALVSNKLVNNTDFDIVSFVVNQVAEAMAVKLEKEFTNGTTSKIEGIVSCTKTKDTASATAITYDELLSVKHSIKQRFQAKAVWLMNGETYEMICKLKDQEGRPYFNDDEYKILNRPVKITDSMDGVAAGKTPIVFGDLSGYTIKATKSVEVQILREKFATKNMLGVISFGEFDAKITDQKKLAKLKMKSA